MKNYDEEIKKLITGRKYNEDHNRNNVTIRRGINKKLDYLTDQMTEEEIYRIVYEDENTAPTLLSFPSKETADEFALNRIADAKAKWRKKYGNDICIYADGVLVDELSVWPHSDDCSVDYPEYVEMQKLYHQEKKAERRKRKRPELILKDGKRYLDLWTTQDIRAYDNMMRTGVLRAPEDSLTFPGRSGRLDDCEWEAYNWICKEMDMRLPGKRPEDVKYPVWAWYKYNGVYGRPDGDILDDKLNEIDEVEIHFEAPLDEVLLTDYENWHGPLNGTIYYDDMPWCLTDAEWEESHERLEEYFFKHPEMKERAWEEIVLVDRHGTKDLYNVQATVWQIRKEWVKDVEFLMEDTSQVKASA